jgi:cytochrome P450
MRIIVTGGNSGVGKATALAATGHARHVPGRTGCDAAADDIMMDPPEHAVMRKLVMISRLTQVDVVRDDGVAKLTDAEIAAFAMMLGGAGAETVTKLIDVTLHGTTIPAASVVMLIIGSATRDERAFVEPDRFDIDRIPSGHNLNFGYGIHSCLGAARARMEGRIALEVIGDSMIAISSIRPAIGRRTDLLEQ